MGEREVARFAADVLPFWSPGPGGTGRRTLVVCLLLLLGLAFRGCFLGGRGWFCLCCVLLCCVEEVLHKRALWGVFRALREWEVIESCFVCCDSWLPSFPP